MTEENSKIDFAANDRAQDLIHDLLKREEETAMREIMQEQEEDLEVTDGELVALGSLMSVLQAKYSHRPGTWANYKSLAEEARDRARDEIGLDVILDWIGPSLMVPPRPPILRVQGRYTDYDHQKNIHEIQSGIADKIWDNKRKITKK